MKKPSTLLKVVSIIMIVFGALGLLSSIALFSMSSAMAPYYEAMGVAAPSTLSKVLALVGSIVMIAAGIIGVAYKSRQLVLIIGISLIVVHVVSIVVHVVSIIDTTVTTGLFSPFTLISLVLPILYMWGWYQSN